MRSICSALAASPARIAAGSPGVRRSIRNTRTATTSSTGSVAARRRKIKAVIGVGKERRPRCGERRGRRDLRLALVLLDVPVDVARTDHEARDVLPRGERVRVLAERGVRRNVERPRLNRLRERFLLRVVRLAGELVAQLLDRLVGGPAEPGFLAKRAEIGRA